MRLDRLVAASVSPGCPPLLRCNQLNSKSNVAK